jgi:hypothetical protein
MIVNTGANVSVVVPKPLAPSASLPHSPSLVIPNDEMSLVGPPQDTNPKPLPHEPFVTPMDLVNIDPGERPDESHQVEFWHLCLMLIHQPEEHIHAQPEHIQLLMHTFFDLHDQQRRMKEMSV